jgi:hypothetical protein
MGIWIVGQGKKEVTDMQKDFTNSSGYVFTVRVLEDGDRYGRNEVLAWEGHPKFGRRGVEFYDTQYAGAAFGPRGQFVSSYYEDTLLEYQSSAGIDLHGGVPVWSIDGATFSEIMDWVQSV